MAEALERPDETSARSAPFIAYLVGFHAAWVGWVLLIYPWLRTLGEATLRYALLNVAGRLLIWVLPVFLYLRYVDRVDPLDYLRLRRRWRRGVLVGLGLTLINALLGLLRYGLPQPSLQALTWNSVLSTSILIGFVEEIPYRGLILRKLEGALGFWPASLLSSLLFLAIHLPGWILLGIFSVETAGFIFIFGMIMALVVRRSGSLWSAIVAHSLNDFLAAIIFQR
jgi:uncharacterized protein